MIQDLNAFICLHQRPFQPFRGLGRWVNYQWCPHGVEDIDSILLRESVCWQALLLVGQQLGLSRQECTNVEVISDSESIHPILQVVVSRTLILTAQVNNAGTAEE